MLNHSNNMDPSLQNVELEKQWSAEFERSKRNYCVAAFLSQHPEAKDYEIADFISRARRSYIRAKLKNMNDAEWDERLHKHIVTFKFIAPLQRELEKLSINQEMVSLEIERARVAKEKAKLEKEKIDFLNEQANLVKNGKSSYYRHLTTISELENTKRELEENYRKEIAEIQVKRDEELKRTVASEIEKVKQHYDQRINKLSQFYELFKQKYQKLQQFNAEIQKQYDQKNQEIHNLELRIVKLDSEIQAREQEIINRDEEIRHLTTEIESKTKEIADMSEIRPDELKKRVNSEVEEQMRAQTNKLNSILLEKEKHLLVQLEKRRKEIEIALVQQQVEHEKISKDLSEAEQVAKLASEELKRVKRDYDVVVYTNRELNQAVKTLSEKNANLTKEIERVSSENAELDKLNNLLVKKYHDSEYIEAITSRLNQDLKRIAKNQEALNKLINSKKKVSDQQIMTQFENIKHDIQTVNANMGNISTVDQQPQRSGNVLHYQSQPPAKVLNYEHDYDDVWFTHDEPKVKAKKTNPKNKNLIAKIKNKNTKSKTAKNGLNFNKFIDIE